MREIDAEMFLEIMRVNTDFELVETPLGICVEMDWVNAFCFAYCTDAVYLDQNPRSYLITPGSNLLQLTNKALEFNIVGGSVFDGESVKHSPKKWSEGGKQYMFQGTKFVLPVQTESQNPTVEKKAFRKKWIDELNHHPEIDSTDFIIMHIDSKKKGNGMEKFLEYITCYNYRERGWVVDNQLSVKANIGNIRTKGTPDFTAFRDDGCEEGYFLVELLLEFAGHQINQVHRNIAMSIVGEAKTGSTVFEDQLDKYLNSGFFNNGFGLLPQHKRLARDDIGLVYIDDDYNLVVLNTDTNHQDAASQVPYFTWFNNLQTCYQLLNGDDNTVLEYVRSLA